MNDFSIFSKDYMKSIHLLGACICEGCVMGEIYAINRVFYLETHGHKYELKFEGIIDKSEKINNLEVHCIKVPEYKVLSNGVYFACDGEKEGKMKLQVITENAFNIKNKELNRENIRLLNDIFENSYGAQDKVILTDAFAFILSEQTDERQLGNNIINKKCFTKCSIQELREILNIQKEKENNIEYCK